MSEMVVIGYPDETTAERAMNEVIRLQQDYMIQLDQVAVVERGMDGRYHTKLPASPTAAGGIWGSFWGLLFGVLFFVPVAGLVFGGVMGMLMGAMAKSGLDREYMDRVREAVKPGTSALFMVIQKVTPDKVIDAMKPFGGTVLRTSLSEDAEERLRGAIEGEEGERVPAGVSSGSQSSM